MREVRKKTPQMAIIDPVTGVAHNVSELHLVDNTAQLMGGTTAIVGKDLVNNSLCRLITNWMGDDGFLRTFDSQK